MVEIEPGSQRKMSLTEIENILGDLEMTSQNIEIPIEQKDKNEYRNLFIKAGAPENKLTDDPQAIKEFFQKAVREKLDNLVFQAPCQENIVKSVKDGALEFLEGCGVFKTSSDKDDLETLIIEVIVDAVRNFDPKIKNPTFIVDLKINRDGPKDFSFTIINPSKKMSRDFKESKHVTGFGTGMKANLAENLGGKIKNIDIMENGEKQCHAFEFTSGLSKPDSSKQEKILEQVA